MSLAAAGLLCALASLAQAPPSSSSSVAAPSSSPAADGSAASFVDRVVAKKLLDDGRSGEAKAVLPGIKAPGKAEAPADAAAEAAKELGKAEALLKKKDAKGALVAFRRALAKAPKTAAPLWGISRAADAAGDKATGKRFAQLCVRSTAKDRSAGMLSSCRWRAEQPDDLPPGPPASGPGAPGQGTTGAFAAGLPTGALPLNGPPNGPPNGAGGNAPSTPPPSTPY